MIMPMSADGRSAVVAAVANVAAVVQAQATAATGKVAVVSAASVGGGVAPIAQAAAGMAQAAAQAARAAQLEAQMQALMRALQAAQEQARLAQAAAAHGNQVRQAQQQTREALRRTQEHAQTQAGSAQALGLGLGLGLGIGHGGGGGAGGVRGWARAGGNGWAPQVLDGDSKTAASSASVPHVRPMQVAKGIQDQDKPRSATPLEKLLQLPVAPAPESAPARVGCGTTPSQNVNNTLSALASGKNIGQIASERGLSLQDVISEAGRSGVKIHWEYTQGDVQVTRVSQGDAQVTYTRDYQHDRFDAEGSYTDHTTGEHKQVDAWFEGNGKTSQNTVRDAQTGQSTSTFDAADGTRTVRVEDAYGRALSEVTTVAGAASSYEVKPGDTLTAIHQQQSQLGWEQFLQTNGITDADQVRPGQVLAVNGASSRKDYAYMPDGQKIEVSTDSSGNRRTVLTKADGRQTTLEGTATLQEQRTAAVRSGIFAEGLSVKDAAARQGISEDEALLALQSENVFREAPGQANKQTATLTIYDPSSNMLVIERRGPMNEFKREVIAADAIFVVGYNPATGARETTTLTGGLGYLHQRAEQSQSQIDGIDRSLNSLNHGSRLDRELQDERDALLQQQTGLGLENGIAQGQAAQVFLSRTAWQLEDQAAMIVQVLPQLEPEPGLRAQATQELGDTVAAIGSITKGLEMSQSGLKELASLDDLYQKRQVAGQAENRLRQEFREWKNTTWLYGGKSDEQIRDDLAHGVPPPEKDAFSSPEEEDRITWQQFERWQQDADAGGPPPALRASARDAWTARNAANDDLTKAEAANKRAHIENSTLRLYQTGADARALLEERQLWQQENPEVFSRQFSRQSELDSLERQHDELQIDILSTGTALKNDEQLLARPLPERHYTEDRQKADKAYAEESANDLSLVNTQEMIKRLGDGQSQRKDADADAFIKGWIERHPQEAKSQGVQLFVTGLQTNDGPLRPVGEAAARGATANLPGWDSLQLALQLKSETWQAARQSGRELVEGIDREHRDIGRDIEKHSMLRDVASWFSKDASYSAQDFTAGKRQEAEQLKGQIDRGEISVASYYSRQHELSSGFARDSMGYRKDALADDEMWGQIDDAVKTTAGLITGIAVGVITKNPLAAIAAAKAVMGTLDAVDDGWAASKGRSITADGRLSWQGWAVKAATGKASAADHKLFAKTELVNWGRAASSVGGVSAGARVALLMRAGGLAEKLGGRALTGAAVNTVQQGVDGAGNLATDALDLAIDGKLGSEEGRERMRLGQANFWLGMGFAPLSGLASGALPLSAGGLLKGAAMQFANEGTFSVAQAELSSWWTQGRWATKGELVATGIGMVGGTLADLVTHPMAHHGHQEGMGGGGRIDTTPHALPAAAPRPDTLLRDVREPVRAVRTDGGLIGAVPPSGAGSHRQDVDAAGYALADPARMTAPAWLQTLGTIFDAGGELQGVRYRVYETPPREAHAAQPIEFDTGLPGPSESRGATSRNDPVRKPAWQGAAFHDFASFKEAQQSIFDDVGAARSFSVAMLHGATLRPDGSAPSESVAAVVEMSFTPDEGRLSVVVQHNPSAPWLRVAHPDGYVPGQPLIYNDADGNRVDLLNRNGDHLLPTINVFRRRPSDLHVPIGSGAPAVVEVPVPEGAFAVTALSARGVAGIEGHLFDSDGRAMPADQLASLIAQHPGYHGQPVIVYSPMAGDGVVSLIQTLSKALKNSNVYGATEGLNVVAPRPLADGPVTLVEIAPARGDNSYSSGRLEAKPLDGLPIVAIHDGVPTGRASRQTYDDIATMGEYRFVRAGLDLALSTGKAAHGQLSPWFEDIAPQITLTDGNFCEIRFGAPYQSGRDAINPKESATNCVNASVTWDVAMSSPVTRLVALPSGFKRLDQVNAIYGSGDEVLYGSKDEALAALAALPDGSRGFLRMGDGEWWHMVNFVRQEGRTAIIDNQAGRVIIDFASSQIAIRVTQRGDMPVVDRTVLSGDRLAQLMGLDDVTVRSQAEGGLAAVGMLPPSRGAGGTKVPASGPSQMEEIERLAFARRPPEHVSDWGTRTSKLKGTVGLEKVHFVVPTKSYVAVGTFNEKERTVRFYPRTQESTESRPEFSPYLRVPAVPIGEVRKSLELNGGETGQQPGDVVLFIDGAKWINDREGWNIASQFGNRTVHLVDARLQTYAKLRHRPDRPWRVFKDAEKLLAEAETALHLRGKHIGPYPTAVHVGNHHPNLGDSAPLGALTGAEVDFGTRAADGLWAFLSGSHGYRAGDPVHLARTNADVLMATRQDGGSPVQDLADAFQAPIRIRPDEKGSWIEYRPRAPSIKPASDQPMQFDRVIQDISAAGGTPLADSIDAPRKVKFIEPPPDESWPEHDALILAAEQASSSQLMLVKGDAFLGADVEPSALGHDGLSAWEISHSLVSNLPFASTADVILLGHSFSGDPRIAHSIALVTRNPVIVLDHAVGNRAGDETGEATKQAGITGVVFMPKSSPSWAQKSTTGGATMPPLALHTTTFAADGGQFLGDISNKTSQPTTSGTAVSWREPLHPQGQGTPVSALLPAVLGGRLPGAVTVSVKAGHLQGDQPQFVQEDGTELSLSAFQERYIREGLPTRPLAIILDVESVPAKVAMQLAEQFQVPIVSATEAVGKGGGRVHDGGAAGSAQESAAPAAKQFSVYVPADSAGMLVGRQRDDSGQLGAVYRIVPDATLVVLDGADAASDAFDGKSPMSPDRLADTLRERHGDLSTVVVSVTNAAPGIRTPDDFAVFGRKLAGGLNTQVIMTVDPAFVTEAGVAVSTAPVRHDIPGQDGMTASEKPLSQMEIEHPLFVATAVPSKAKGLTEEKVALSFEPEVFAHGGRLVDLSTPPGQVLSPERIFDWRVDKRRWGRSSGDPVTLVPASRREASSLPSSIKLPNDAIVIRAGGERNLKGDAYSGNPIDAYARRQAHVADALVDHYRRTVHIDRPSFIYVCGSPKLHAQSIADRLGVTVVCSVGPDSFTGDGRPESGAGFVAMVPKGGQLPDVLSKERYADASRRTYVVPGATLLRLDGSTVRSSSLYAAWDAEEALAIIKLVHLEDLKNAPPPLLILDFSRNTIGLDSTEQAARFTESVVELLDGYVPVMATARRAYESESGVSLVLNEASPGLPSDIPCQVAQFSPAQLEAMEQAETNAPVGSTRQVRLRQAVGVSEQYDVNDLLLGMRAQERFAAGGARKANLSYLRQGDASAFQRSRDARNIQVVIDAKAFLVLAEHTRLPDIDTLEADIRNHADYRPGQDVVLGVCFGARPSGTGHDAVPDSLAHRLADRLGSRVHAVKNELTLGARNELDAEDVVVARPTLPVANGGHVDGHLAARQSYWLQDNAGNRIDDPFGATMRRQGALIQGILIDPLTLGGGANVHPSGKGAPELKEVTVRPLSPTGASDDPGVTASPLSPEAGEPDVPAGGVPIVIEPSAWTSKDLTLALKQLADSGKPLTNVKFALYPRPFDDITGIPADPARQGLDVLRTNMNAQERAQFYRDTGTAPVSSYDTYGDALAALCNDDVEWDGIALYQPADSQNAGDRIPPGSVIGSMALDGPRGAHFRPNRDYVGTIQSEFEPRETDPALFAIGETTRFHAEHADGAYSEVPPSDFRVQSALHDASLQRQTLMSELPASVDSVDVASIQAWLKRFGIRAADVRFVPQGSPHADYCFRGRPEVGGRWDPVLRICYVREPADMSPAGLAETHVTTAHELLHADSIPASQVYVEAVPEGFRFRMSTGFFKMDVEGAGSHGRAAEEGYAVYKSFAYGREKQGLRASTSDQYVDRYASYGLSNGRFVEGTEMAVVFELLAERHPEVGPMLDIARYNPAGDAMLREFLGQDLYKDIFLCGESGFSSQHVQEVFGRIQSHGSGIYSKFNVHDGSRNPPLVAGTAPRRADLSYLEHGDATIAGQPVDGRDVQLAVGVEAFLVLAEHSRLPSIDRLVADVRAHPDYRPGQDVVLGVCDGGHISADELVVPDSIAHQLADRLGSRVQALKSQLTLGAENELDVADVVVALPQLPLVGDSVAPQQVVRQGYWFNRNGVNRVADPFGSTMRSQGAHIGTDPIDPLTLGGTGSASPAHQPPSGTGPVATAGAGSHPVSPEGLSGITNWDDAISQTGRLLSMKASPVPSVNDAALFNAVVDAGEVFVVSHSGPGDAIAAAGKGVQAKKKISFGSYEEAAEAAAKRGGAWVYAGVPDAQSLPPANRGRLEASEIVGAIFVRQDRSAFPFAFPNVRFEAMPAAAAAAAKSSASKQGVNVALLSAGQPSPAHGSAPQRKQGAVPSTQAGAASASGTGTQPPHAAPASTQNVTATSPGPLPTAGTQAHQTGQNTGIGPVNVDIDKLIETGTTFTEARPAYAGPATVAELLAAPPAPTAEDLKQTSYMTTAGSPDGHRLLEQGVWQRLGRFVAANLRRMSGRSFDEIEARSFLGTPDFVGDRFVIAKNPQDLLLNGADGRHELLAPQHVYSSFSDARDAASTIMQGGTTPALVVRLVDTKRQLTAVAESSTFSNRQIDGVVVIRSDGKVGEVSVANQDAVHAPRPGVVFLNPHDQMSAGEKIFSTWEKTKVYLKTGLTAAATGAGFYFSVRHLGGNVLGLTTAAGASVASYVGTRDFILRYAFDAFLYRGGVAGSRQTAKIRLQKLMSPAHEDTLALIRSLSDPDLRQAALFQLKHQLGRSFSPMSGIPASARAQYRQALNTAEELSGLKSPDSNQQAQLSAAFLLLEKGAYQRTLGSVTGARGAFHRIPSGLQRLYRDEYNKISSTADPVDPRSASILNTASEVRRGMQYGGPLRGGLLRNIPASARQSYREAVHAITKDPFDFEALRTLELIYLDTAVQRTTGWRGSIRGLPADMRDSLRLEKATWDRQLKAKVEDLQADLRADFAKVQIDVASRLTSDVTALKASGADTKAIDARVDELVAERDEALLEKAIDGYLAIRGAVTTLPATAVLEKVLHSTPGAIASANTPLGRSLLAFRVMSFALSNSGATRIPLDPLMDPSWSIKLDSVDGVRKAVSTLGSVLFIEANNTGLTASILKDIAARVKARTGDDIGVAYDPASTENLKKADEAKTNNTPFVPVGPGGKSLKFFRETDSQPVLWRRIKGLGSDLVKHGGKDADGNPVPVPAWHKRLPQWSSFGDATGALFMGTADFLQGVSYAKSGHLDLAGIQIGKVVSDAVVFRACQKDYLDEFRSHRKLGEVRYFSRTTDFLNAPMGNAKLTPEKDSDAIIRYGLPALALLGLGVVGRVLTEELSYLERKQDYVAINPAFSGQVDIPAIARAKAAEMHISTEEALAQIFDRNPTYDRKLLDGKVDPSRPDDPDGLPSGTLIRVGGMGSDDRQSTTTTTTTTTAATTSLNPSTSSSSPPSSSNPQPPTTTTPLPPPASRRNMGTPVVVKSGDTVESILQRELDRVLFPSEQQVLIKQGGAEKVKAEALQQFVNLNPSFRFDTSKIDGVLSGQPGDPDYIDVGWKFNVDRFQGEQTTRGVK